MRGGTLQGKEARDTFAKEREIMLRQRSATFTKQQFDRYMRVQGLELKVPHGKQMQVIFAQDHHLERRNWDDLASSQKLQVFKAEGSDDIQIWVFGYESRARSLNLIPHKVKGEKIPDIVAAFCKARIVPKQANLASARNNLRHAEENSSQPYANQPALLRNHG